MLHAKINGIELEYMVQGSGELVILIQGAIVADANLPLVLSPILTKKFQMIHYHRRGYAGSSHSEHDCQVDICQQANDCLWLMHYLGIKSVHGLGHSIGGSIALQMATDNPELVHSLSLLEPALTGYKPPNDSPVDIQDFIVDLT